jgi:membrane protein implicated in regulation of membrane protease activity
MCHLILLMPVFALVVFWVWPLTVAGPVYAAVVALSLWMYVLILQAMRRPVLGGSEELLHSIGEVMEVRDHALRVRVHSEMWNAESDDALQRGERVKVIGLTGLILRVRRCQDDECEA